MTDRAGAIVLGAGIAGTALAYHLQGRLDGPVVVIDPRTPAAGATGRAAGIVTEQMWDRWDFDVVRESRAEYAALAARHDPGAYRVNGFVRWTVRADIADALRAAGARLRSWGAAIEELTPAALARRLPSVRVDDVVAVQSDPNDAVVGPSALAEAYLADARAHGAEAVLGEASFRLRSDGEGWVFEGGGRAIRAPVAVVAAGAWSKRLLTELGAPLPLAPYRTQAALLRPPAPDEARFPSAHDLDVDVYVRPEENGRILAGDGTRLVEVDPESAPLSGDDEFVTHVAETFASRFPGWADAELVRAWAGVCTSTPDRRPLIGPVPGRRGLFCLVGFNGFGVMRAGGAAGRLADAIAAPDDGRARERLDPVRPDRFSPPFRPFDPRPGFTLEGGADPRF